MRHATDALPRGRRHARVRWSGRPIRFRADSAAFGGAQYAFGEPGISPDGSEIAFTSGGDIWTVPASGGDARLLAADPAYDRRPLFSPDGRELAFVSSRTGGGDIYVVTLATGTFRRVTWDDGAGAASRPDEAPFADPGP